MERRPPQPRPEPNGRLTKRERREQRRAAGRVQKERSERWQRQRRLLIKGGFALGALGGLVAIGIRAAAIQNLQTVADKLQGSTEKEQEFSGEIEETRDYLNKWVQEVQANPKNKEQYMGRMRDLSIAYFSTQMTKMFPDKADQYKKETFKNRWKFLSENEFAKRPEQCEKNDPSVPSQSNIIDQNILVQSQRIINYASSSREFVDTVFTVFIHELLHNAAPRFENTQGGVRADGVRGPAQYQKGLRLYWKDPKESYPEEGCFTTAWSDIEETVVQDAAIELVNKVGVFQFSPSRGPQVRSYRASVRSLFGGDYKPLLERHQASDMNGFLMLLGSKRGVVDPERQLRAGYREITGHDMPN